MSKNTYKGIVLDDLDKDVKLSHSRALERNINTDYLEKIIDYKKADLSTEYFDAINKLWSVAKMNYQICNGGIWQYYYNGFDEEWSSEDGETVIWDKEGQIEMLRELAIFGKEIFPENKESNSKFESIINAFESLYIEKNVPQYETIYCDEDKEIWDDDLEDWVENEEYFEPYEECVGNEDEMRSRDDVIYPDDFDTKYYEVNDYLEQLVELYAQYLDKSVEKEKHVSLNDVIHMAEERAGKDNVGSLEDKELDI